jgi:hypothetical protein
MRSRPNCCGRALEGLSGQCLTVDVARSALRLSIALWEMCGVGETAVAHGPFMVRGGAGAMSVRLSQGVAMAAARVGGY